MIKPILTVPNSILRAKSKDVSWDKKTQDFVQALSKTLLAKTNPRGVGLSAPQISKNWNLFVTLVSKNDEDASEKDLRVFINPVVIDSSKEMTLGSDGDEPFLEGCLSIPGLYGPVPRHEWVVVEYQTPTENNALVSVKTKFSDFAARVVQHEYDHLQGVLFTDYSQKLDLPVYEFVGKKMKEIDKSILKAY